MKVKFASGGFTRDLSPQGVADLRRRIETLEGYGFEHLGLPDSQSLWPELYVVMTLMALYSKRAKLWTTVTNPLTRHPAVAASAHASIDELSGGRVIFNIGSGDSAVYNLGLKGASLPFFREYVIAVKELFDKKETVYQGKTIRLIWPKRKIPVYVTAEGPKTLEMAGELCDGVYVGVGVQPELVKDALKHIEIGAKKAGRKLKDIDIWWFIKGDLVDNKEQGIHDMRMALTASANHAFRFTLEGKFIPEQYKASIKRLQERYTFSQHELMHGANADLLDEVDPKLKYYLAERFAIIGPPSEYVKKIRALADLGITQMSAGTGMGDGDPMAKIRRFAEEVMPAFR